MSAGKHKRVLFAFLVVVSSLAFLLFRYHSPKTPPAPFTGAENLDKAFTTGGIDLFREKKTELRNQVHEAMRSMDEEEEPNEALQLAVYLFPDLLPREDFEAQVAMELWTPHQKQIENSPGTEESRRTFEEMRANIWNYETAERRSPQLTGAAKRVIEIYDTLSALE